MAFNNRGVNAYRNVSVASAVPYADSVQLIQMLFDGLMTCLADAEGHFERNDIKGKHESIGKATKILVGLQSALDFEEGKELATNLSDLYDYCVRRLLKANIRNDIDGIKEVRSLIQDVKGAWEMLPQSLNKDVKVSMVS